MKALLYSVLPRPPHPTRDGLAIRNFHLLRALAREFRVRAFSLLDPERAYGRGEVPEGVTVDWIPQPGRRLRRVAAVVSSLVGRGAYPERVYRSRELSRRLATAVAADPPSWIVAHSYHVGPAALAAGRRAWVDFHNLDSQIWRRVAQSASSASVRAFARGQAPRVVALERRLASEAAGISCVSEPDAAALSAFGAGAAPLVVPNGVDLSRYAIREEEPLEEVVLFVGDLSWPPNADAVPPGTSHGGSRPTSCCSAKGTTRGRIGRGRRSRWCRCGPAGARG